MLPAAAAQQHAAMCKTFANDRRQRHSAATAGSAHTCAPESVCRTKPTAAQVPAPLRPSSIRALILDKNILGVLKEIGTLATCGDKIPHVDASNCL